MKSGWWMLAGSVLSAFGIVEYLGDEATPELRLAVWLGMLGPLAVALWAAAAVDRAYRRQPASVMGVMITAFVAKMVFFGGYVALIMKSGWVTPVPFAISFLGYFIALFIVEAFRLRRLFTGV